MNTRTIPKLDTLHWPRSNSAATLLVVSSVAVVVNGPTIVVCATVLVVASL